MLNSLSLLSSHISALLKCSITPLHMLLPRPQQCVSTLPLQSTQLTPNIFHIPKQVTFSGKLYVTFCHIIYYNCNYMFTCYYLIVYLPYYSQ